MLEIVIEFVIEIGICRFTMAWALPVFQHSVTGYIRIAVFVL